MLRVGGTAGLGRAKGVGLALRLRGGEVVEWDGVGSLFVRVIACPVGILGGKGRLRCGSMDSWSAIMVMGMTLTTVNTVAIHPHVLVEDTAKMIY